MIPCRSLRPRAARIAVLLAALASLLPLTAPAQEPGGILSGPSILAFARSLYEEGDYDRACGEFLRYQFMEPNGEQNREIAFMIATCHERSGESERAKKEYLAIAGSGSDEWALKSLFETAIIESLLGNGAAALEILRAPGLPSLSETYDPLLLQGWCLLLEDEWTQAEEPLARSTSPLAFELRSLAKKGTTLPRKSPALAGFLSTLLPGAGKLYADRPLDALFSLSLIGSLAVMSGLGFAEDGLRSVKGWAYGSLAFGFHVGNIYGAIQAAKGFNRDRAQRVERQARDFHETYFR